LSIGWIASFAVLALAVRRAPNRSSIESRRF
jgi:hypothetical protein